MSNRRLTPALIDNNKIKIYQVRQLIPSSCYQRSMLKNLAWFVADLLVFLLGLGLIYCSPQHVLKLIGSLFVSAGTAMMFLWAHDAAHGALFKSLTVSEILGTLFMLPSLNVYRQWIYGHNKHHHGFTAFTRIDRIWRPLTVKGYSKLSRFEQQAYRIERSLFGCGLHYLRHIWWKMLMHNPGVDLKSRQYYQQGQWIVIAYMALMAVLAYRYFGGLEGIVLVLLLPALIFNYVISIVVYLHHTHPDIPFFRDKRGWSNAVGALSCSTVVHNSCLVRLLLHNIMIHIPHHLDIRIPFYHLPKAYEAIKKDYGQYFHEYHFNWRYVAGIFKQCKLYDFKNKRWLTFKNVSL